MPSDPNAPPPSSDPAATPADAGQAGRPLRNRLARGVLVLLFIGGIWGFQQFQPTQVQMQFEVPPTLATGQGQGLRRRDLTRLDVTVVKPPSALEPGESPIVARVSLELARLELGPLTPPVVVTAVPGGYLVDTKATARDGRVVQRVSAWTLERGHETAVLSLDR